MTQRTATKASRCGGRFSGSSSRQHGDDFTLTRSHAHGLGRPEALCAQDRGCQWPDIAWSRHCYSGARPGPAPAPVRRPWGLSVTNSVAVADRAERFQILALDGGGAKALFSAHVLARLEADLGVRIADAFDLITGTSAGGIIALALGAGLRAAEIAAQYERLVATVFPVADAGGGGSQAGLRTPATMLRSCAARLRASSARACWETAASGLSSRPGMFRRPGCTSSRHRTTTGSAATGRSLWSTSRWLRQPHQRSSPPHASTGIASSTAGLGE